MENSNKPECSNCGRPLTNPDSIRIGIGPICRGQYITKEKSLKNQIHLFKNRASYSWGIQDGVLWLIDSEPNSGRSLTNDMENALVEISQELPEGTSLLDYPITYRDSMGIWDRVSVDIVGDLSEDYNRLTKSNGLFFSRNIRVGLSHIGKPDLLSAIAAIKGESLLWFGMAETLSTGLTHLSPADNPTPYCGTRAKVQSTGSLHENELAEQLPPAVCQRCYSSVKNLIKYKQDG